MVQPGDIVHLFFRSIRDQKYKYAVVACMSPRPGFFLINSEITEFAQKRKDLLAAKVKIHAEEHGCLRHNSFVDTAEMFGEYSADDLENAIKGDPNIIRGRISERCRERMLRAVSESRLLPQVKKDWVVAAFTDDETA